jgi:hypothetical protein
MLLHPLGSPGPWPENGPAASIDLETFRRQHAAHGLEEAVPVDERSVLEGALGDPMATRWFHVAVGTERLTVRSWRPSIELARRTELVVGDVPEPLTWVDVDEALLRAALDRHFYPQVIRTTQLDAVLASVRQLTAPLDPYQVETEFDDPALPDTAIGPFPAVLGTALLERCHGLFDSPDLERLRGFIADHSGVNGALALRVHRTLAPRAA